MPHLSLVALFTGVAGSLDEGQRTVGKDRPHCWLGISFNSQLALVEQNKEEIVQ